MYVIILILLSLTISRLLNVLFHHFKVNTYAKQNYSDFNYVLDIGKFLCIHCAHIMYVGILIYIINYKIELHQVTDF